MIRTIFLFLVAVTAIGAGAVFWSKYGKVRDWVYESVETGKFQTLELRFTADAIMQAHKKELLKDNRHTYLEPELKFYPYLLMEIKYAHGKDKTGEGVMLWSLVDGEMVLNTNTWEMTHGFIDCIHANADRNEFKILNALANRGGFLDRESLLKMLNVETELLDRWVESCRRKNLIVQSGNLLRLHLQNPRLFVKPETKLDHWLVTKVSKYSHRIPRNFNPSQIEYIAKAAFGPDFAIRKSTEIFLPVYSITVQNPDDSMMTTYWNALNGKRIEQPFVLE